ncbi:MAG: CPBP family intramembrane metalloprotease [Chitinophagales bacterium]|nr:CPBP family intramembrane metalloprotease [Chitinophagales bacterium]
MKIIIGYLKDYWKEQNVFHLIFVAIFLAIAIDLNYLFDIENGIIDKYYHSFKHFYLYFILYACSIIPMYLSYFYDEEGRKMLSKPGLWGRILLALGSFSLYCYIYQYKEWIDRHFFDYYTANIIKICADQIVQSSILSFIIVVFWFWRDRKFQNLYGFSLKNAHISIYFYLLLLMVPIVFAASFSHDFQTYYPTARRVLIYITETMPKAWWITLYEFCYASEFFHVEFFFRGFLILAFVKYAGSRAIIPAAMFYCFIHFGKPMGECISSFFGGIILGLLCYRSNSIAAGVLIHIGIAMLMELIAGIWLSFT